VVLLDADGVAEFAARSGDVFPVRRGTRKPAPPARAASGIPVRGVAEIDRGDGIMTTELNIDSALGLP
jgi:hypothetical protein